MEMMLFEKGQPRSGHRYLFLESVATLKCLQPHMWPWVNALIIHLSYNGTQMNCDGTFGV